MTSDRFAAHDVTVLVTYFGRIAPGGSKERDRRKLEVASAAEELDPAKNWADGAGCIFQIGSDFSLRLGTR
ncbi:hypothetical protein [Sphingopyxis sp.]|uniref:hypothetical protein n=1 Tax=Sphingopyxis sp. TaxID=1908224 RepID=UPI00261918F7|nr:hypothetical protein [Sphingopyxis sp.]MCW0198872.1 hypothetical protein [Sphingopyxis sp.]